MRLRSLLAVVAGLLALAPAAGAAKGAPAGRPSATSS
jgi:hypothetical protein